jgi:hypothetical protein
MPPAALLRCRFLRLVILASAALTPASAQYCHPGAATACSAVLVVCADYLSSYCADVQASLRGTGAFTTVDTFDAAASTPGAAELAGYDAVLVHSNQIFSNPALLGDRLAAFHDQGGGVVVANFANSPTDWNSASAFNTNLQGAYATPGNGYSLLNYALGNVVYPPPADSLSDVLEPESPLLHGVASFSAQLAYRSTAPVIAGRAVVVARWGGGEPLVLRGMRGARTLVELNCYPVSNNARDGWTGDGANLLRNALKYSRCMLCTAGTFAAAGNWGGNWW